MTNPQRRAWIGPVVGVAVMLLLVVFCLAAAVAWAVWHTPKGRRSPTREAQYNLSAIFVLERDSESATGRYEESVEALDWSPPGSNRYRYIFARTGDSRVWDAPPDGGPHTGFLADTLKYPSTNNARLLSGIPADVLNTVGIADAGITVIAAGDIDSDPTVDVWSVSTMDRAIDGGLIRAGVPFRHVNDDVF